MAIEKPDLEIPLTASQVEPVKNWVQSFNEQQVTMVAEPAIENGVLKIAPFDFPNLLGYINKNHSNEFDIFRLKAMGVGRIKKLMAKKKAATVKKYYADCLALIEGAEIGIYVERIEPRVPTRPFGGY